MGITEAAAHLAVRCTGFHELAAIREPPVTERIQPVDLLAREFRLIEKHTSIAIDDTGDGVEQTRSVRDRCLFLFSSNRDISTAHSTARPWPSTSSPPSPRVTGTTRR